MSRRPSRNTPPGAWAVVVARAGTVLIDVCAFWLSATTLTDLARRAGIDPMQAWMWPVIVDGMIVVATVAIVALAPHGLRATIYPWVLLSAGAAVSVAANCLHALVDTGSDLPPVLAASVAAVPPLVLLAATHLTVQLGTRLTRIAPATVDDATVDVTPPGVPPRRRVVGERETRSIASPTDSADRARAAPLCSAPSLDAAPDNSPFVHEPSAPGDGERSTAPARVRRDSAETASAAMPRAAAAGSDARDQAASLSEEGLSNRAIATRLGVHPSTVGRWLTSPTMPSPGGPRPSPTTEHPAPVATEGRPEPYDGTASPDSKESQP